MLSLLKRYAPFSVALFILSPSILLSLASRSTLFLKGQCFLLNEYNRLCHSVFRQLFELCKTPMVLCATFAQV